MKLKDLIVETKTIAQDNVGNAFITKYSNGYVTIHVGGRSNSTIQFSKNELSKLIKVLRKMK